MKTFTQYLSESTKKYDFRVKVAGEFTTEQEATLKSLLSFRNEIRYGHHSGMRKTRALTANPATRGARPPWMTVWT